MLFRSQKVYVPDSGIARARMVTTGVSTADGIEILSGLSDGEQIVNPVPPQLIDGSHVEVRQ